MKEAAVRESAVVVIPDGMHRSRWTARRSSSWGIDSWTNSRVPGIIAVRPVTRDEAPSVVRDALDLTAPLPADLFFIAKA